MTVRFPLRLCALASLAVVLLQGTSMCAQTPDTTAKPTGDTKSPEPHTASASRYDCNSPQVSCFVKTYYLHNVTQQNDSNEILVALRNVLDPHVKIFLVSSDNAVVVYAPAEQHQMAVNLIRDLDLPKRSYRLTYTLTESDAGKRVGVQHYSLLVVTGQRTTSKEGSKVPLETGSYSASGSQGGVQQQFQYLDLGLNFDASLDAYGDDVRLRTKVEESSTAEDKNIGGVTEPVIRQAVLEGTAILVPGKTVTLGSLDVHGSTRRIDIDVTADPLP